MMTAGNSDSFSHEDLVRRAERWLRNSAKTIVSYSNKPYPARCSVILTEPASSWEQPDAIGWHSGSSILIECKVTRSDYLADLKKPARRARIDEVKLGRERYYMTPKGLLSPNELPPKWGLLEVKGRRVYVTRYAEPNREYCIRREMEILLSELRKVQIVQNGGELHPTRAARRIESALGVQWDGSGI